MKIVLNGKPRELTDERTVADLLDRLSLERHGVAVAVNGSVVPRSKHAEHALNDGDTLEVIRAVGGG